MWPDDFVENGCPGALRTLGLRKTTAGTKSFYWSCPKVSLKRFAGRAVTFGVLVWQKVQNTPGKTWTVRISDTAGDSVSQHKGIGSAYSEQGYGGFEFLSVTRVIAPNADRLNCEIVLEGDATDVYYVALPTAVYGKTLTRELCGQNAEETILAMNHWNPPMLTPLEQTFPPTPIIYPLYGYQGLDIEALSNGSVHRSVKAIKTKLEMNVATAGINFMCGSRISNESLIFGPQVYSQNGALAAGAGWWPVDTEGCVAIVVAAPSQSVSVTFDLDAVMA